MRNGAFTQQPKPEPPTSGGGSSSWPTATVTDASGSAYAYSGGDHSKVVLKLLGAAKMLHIPGLPAPQTTGPESLKKCTRRLNPLFVERLMGFPVGWTDCEPSETPSSPSKQN